MRTKEDIFEEVRTILCSEFDFDSDEVLPTSHLIDDLDLDSIDAIDLAARLEETVGLELEEQQLRELRLVQDVVDVVYAHLDATAGSA